MLNRLKELRMNKGLTQQMLADEMGTTKHYISNLETGKRDIGRIHGDTIYRLCKALDCEISDILQEFEYEENLLIVDELYYNNTRDKYIVKINECYYVIPDTNEFYEKIDANRIYQYKGSLPPGDKERFPHTFLHAGCVPRNGFMIELGRCITDAELNNLCEKYNIKPEDISDPYEDTKGQIYGEKYAVHYKSIQIRLDDPQLPFTLERELRKQGVEAITDTAFRLSVRVE